MLLVRFHHTESHRPPCWQARFVVIATNVSGSFDTPSVESPVVTVGAWAVCVACTREQGVG